MNPRNHMGDANANSTIRLSYYWLLCCGLFLGMLSACTNDHEDNSPEAVTRAYIQWVNTGEIKQAKSLCTPAAVAYLDALAAVIAATETQPDSAGIQIESIQCSLSEDQQTAQCEGLIDDGYERYTEQLFLSQVEGQWRIDHQPDEGTLQSSEEVLTEDETIEE